MRNKTRGAALRWLLKHYLFLAVIVFLITFALIPMHGAMKVHTIGESVSSRPETEPILPSTAYYFTRELSRNFLFFPLNLEMLCAVFGSMGFGSALVLFGYRFSRKQSMMFAGLPVTRSRGFLLRTAVFLILAAVPVAVCCLGYPSIVILSGLGDYFDPGLYLKECTALMLILLYGFSAGALSAQLFGNLWAAVLGGALIIGSLEACCFGWSLFASCYLQTLCIHPVRSMTAWSPIYALYKGLYQAGTFRWLPGAAAILILGALAWRVSGLNRPERAGATLNIRQIEKPLLFWATVVGGTLGGVLFIETFVREYSLYLGILLGAAGAWIVAKMLVEQNLRLHFQGWRGPAAALAVMLLCCLGLRMDILGLTGRMPEIDDFQAITASSSYQWEHQPETLFRAEEGENLAAAQEWARLLRDHSAELRKEQPFTLGNYEQKVNIRWENRNHQILERQYSPLEDQMPALEALKTLVNSQEYRSQAAEKVIAYDQSSGNAILMNGLRLQEEDFLNLYGFNLWSEFDRRSPEALRDALRADIMDRTWEDMQGMAVAQVYFYKIDEVTDAYVSCPTQTVYASDERTVRALWGEKSDAVLAWVRGGWADNTEILVFRCEYETDEEDHRNLIRYTQAASPEEAVAWVNRTSQCRESLFRAPENEQVQIQIYARPAVRRWADREGMTDLLEEEDFWSHLPDYSEDIYYWVGYEERADLPEV